MAGVGILGGTFDPVHCAHLALALGMREHLGLDTVRLAPAAEPRLRVAPVASAAARCAMLHAAVAGIAALEVDARELRRPGPTCTVDTLAEMRSEQADEPLCFLMGLDAFLRFDRWERWREIPRLAHLAIARRPRASLPERGPLARLLERHGSADPAELLRRPAGLVHVADLSVPDISASGVRRRLARGLGVEGLVPPAVLEVIETRGGYRPCNPSK